MIWESFSLDKLYRTKDFKMTLPKYFSTVNKAPLIQQIDPYLSYYGLNSQRNETIQKQTSQLDTFGFDIYLNKDTCSLYHKYADNSTYYFNYYTNGFFYLYTQIYLNGKKHFENQFNNKIIDESVIYQWERYLLLLNFLNEINSYGFATALTDTIEYHLRYNSFIFNELSYYDIILLSIISRNSIFTSSIANNNNNNTEGNSTVKPQYPSIKRWYNYIKAYLDLDFDTIQKLYNQKEKENLFETYKMTSNQTIVQALREKNYELLESMLKINNENVNSRNLKEFKTLCHWACAKADRKALDILIQYKCDLEALDFENMTPIYDAVYSGDIDFCEYLITEKKVNLNHKEIQDRTPFYWAACTGRIEMIKYLLTKPNIDINAASKMGRTSLSKACWNGQVDVTELLCEQKGILINTPDNNGRYPLHNAAWGEYGGRQGKKMSGLTSTDSPQATLCLINHGANVEVVDNEGDSPFMIAGSTNGIESMKILIKHGADPNRANKKGRTALIQATQYGNWESVQAILAFANEGYYIDLNIRDIHSYRAIDYAVLYQRIICFTVLFDNDKSYQTLVEMVYLAKLAIESNSCLCFEYILGCLIKLNGDIDNNESMMMIYEELINKALAMQNIICFNVIYKAIPTITKEILLKTRIKIQAKENEKNSMLTNKSMIELIYACHLMTMDDSALLADNTNTISLIPEQPLNYKEIKEKKMTEINNMFFFQETDEPQPVTQNWTPEMKKTFNDTIAKLLKEYLNENIKDNVIDDTIIKIIIKNNLFSLISDKVKDSLNIQHSTSNTMITIKKEYHNQLFVMKQGITPSNNYDSFWKEIIDYYNTNSILSIAITANTANEEKGNDDCFDFLIKLKSIKDTIFNVTPIRKKNIFHILFSNPDYKPKFESIIQIIESEYSSKISLIPIMLNKTDSSSSTPLDVLMKAENYSMLETYTTIIHNLLSKHSINTNNIQSIDLYIIKTFTITPREVSASLDYKNYIYERLKQLKIKNNTKSNNKNTNDNQKDIYTLSGYLIEEDAKEKMQYCLSQIKQNTIENDFCITNKDYQHKFIQTEIELIEVSKALNKEKVIGIDAEFYGNNCEIDGIVCLIQISTFTMSYAIDTLSLRKEITKWLKPIFINESIIKVLHGCDNDICWLLSNFDLELRNIYDTGRAFLVFQNIILNKVFKLDNLPSLYYLVKFFMGVKLDKSYQTSDWRIRPLTNNMLQYGYNDSKSVLYLYYLFQGLYLWLIKDAFIIENSDNLDYYKNIKPLFAKDREVLAKIPNDLPIEETKPLLCKIAYKCFELIKNKLKDTYTHLDITLTN